MNAHFKSLMFQTLFFFVVTLVFCLHADDNPEAGKLETLLAKRLPANGPGVVVLVARDGKLIFSRSYGLADRES